MTIKWVTRSGSNTFVGSAYQYFRHWALNSNYYFNAVSGLPKSQIQLHQFGAREGGPIRKGKAFFFVNMEEFRRPASATNQRYVLSSAAQAGIFRYGTSGSVDLLALAAQKGQTSTTDATTLGLLNRIQAVTATTGNLTATSDPNVSRYTFQGQGGRNEDNPTVRIDVNLTDSHRLTGTHNFQRAFQHPDLLNNNDPTFPGFANYADQSSYRNLGSYTLRSIRGSNLVNELIGGFLWSPIDFNGPLGPSQFADQGGFNLVMPTLGGTALTGATITSSMSKRNASHWDINDTLSWLKGNHSVAFGGAFTKVNYWTTTQTAAPSLSFGVDATNDPASVMFTGANFPGASTADLANARALYALLTGRVTQIGGNLRLDDQTGQYDFMGAGRQAGGMKEFGFFAQDAWRIKTNLTLNLGLRWEVQMPFTPANSIFSSASLDSFCGVSGVSNGTCNLFKPGTMPGNVTTYDQYKIGTAGYNTDWNNVAPSLGAAWRPRVKSGFVRALLGDPEQATIRGGYSVAYNRDSIGTFTGVFNSNPGVTITQNRNSTTGNLVLPGQTWPVLLRDGSRVAPLPACTGAINAFCSQPSPVYPLSASVANSVNIFDPNFEVAHTKSFTLGLQRGLSKDMAVEIRYVGTRNSDQLTTQNFNEVVIVENGFFDEFRQAQANLQSNIAAGRGATFAYFGPGTGTSALPIYLANFTGKGASFANDPKQYTGTNWTNATQVAQTRPPPGWHTRDSRGGLAAKQRDVQGEPRRRGAASQLLGDEPERERGERNAQHRVHPLRRAPDRGAATCGSGTLHRRQLHAREALLVCERHAAAAVARGSGHGGRQARGQGELGLRDSGRQEPPLRQRHEPGSERDRGRLGVRRRRPRAERESPELRERQAGGHDARRPAERVSHRHSKGPDYRRLDGVHAAAGHHRQHDPRVQRQRDLGNRIRRGAADRAIPGARERCVMSAGRAWRLCAARRVRDRAGLLALGLHRAEDIPAWRQAQFPDPDGHVQRVQGDWLQPCRAGEQQRNDRPGDQRVSGHQQHLRPGWKGRPGHDSVQLVTRGPCREGSWPSELSDAILSSSGSSSPFRRRPAPARRCPGSPPGRAL